MTGSFFNLWAVKCQDVWCRNWREKGTPRVHHGEGDNTYVLHCGNEGGGSPWQPFSGGAGYEDMLCPDFSMLCLIVWLYPSSSIPPLFLGTLFHSSPLFLNSRRQTHTKGSLKEITRWVSSVCTNKNYNKILSIFQYQCSTFKMITYCAFAKE